MSHQTISKRSIPGRLLIRWANDSDEWVRRIVQVVLVTSARLSEEACDSAYALFLEEKRFNDRYLPREPKILATTNDHDQDIEFTLQSISDVRNVNALDPGMTIEFGSGLTILYGENGTGKTGYSRILKCLANSRSVEEILPNMHQPSTSSDPAAKIGYAVGFGTPDTRLERGTGYRSVYQAVCIRFPSTQSARRPEYRLHVYPSIHSLVLTCYSCSSGDTVPN